MTLQQLEKYWQLNKVSSGTKYNPNWKPFKYIINWLYLTTWGFAPAKQKECKHCKNADQVFYNLTVDHLTTQRLWGIVNIAWKAVTLICSINWSTDMLEAPWLLRDNFYVEGKENKEKMVDQWGLFNNCKLYRKFQQIYMRILFRKRALFTVYKHKFILSLY